MKFQLLALSIVSAISPVAAWSAAAGETGGLSFDFNALSAAKFGAASGRAPEKVSYEEALGFVYLPTAKGPLPSPAEVRKHCRWYEENGERVVAKDPGILDLCKGNADYAAAAVAAWKVNLEVPATETQTYRVSFDYKMNHTVGDNGLVIAQTEGVSGWLAYVRLENCDSEWKPFVADVTLRKGVKSPLSGCCSSARGSRSTARRSTARPSGGRRTGRSRRTADVFESKPGKERARCADGSWHRL